ncbi:hypothetical protein HDU76_004471 [Blyttiomyces sp. JEL0837]|nr:hypothetical protein HDU76_004471 [Blyttiomyces sp. JEL0837]
MTSVAHFNSSSASVSTSLSNTRSDLSVKSTDAVYYESGQSQSQKMKAALGSSNIRSSHDGVFISRNKKNNDAVSSICHGTPPLSSSGVKLCESIEDYTNKYGFEYLTLSEQRLRELQSKGPSLESIRNGSQKKCDYVCERQKVQVQEKVGKKKWFSGMMKWIRGGLKPKNNRSDIMVALA